MPGALHGNTECLNFAPDTRDAKTIRTLALWHHGTSATSGTLARSHPAPEQ